MSVREVIKAYSGAAPELIDRFSAISSTELFKPVHDLLPRSRARVVDIGAGPGRDAAWFASMGHTVLAVEPVKEFRDAGMASDSLAAIEWIDDRLPELIETKRRGQFELVVLCAVWHHINASQRLVAMRNLAELTTSGGLLVMSLRHGPGVLERTVYPPAPEETVGVALREGFSLLNGWTRSKFNPPIQLQGVRWTWDAFSKH